MKQFRIYLKSELGKLANEDDARSFLEKIPPKILQECSIPLVVSEVMASFSSQEKVNEFVDLMHEEHLKALTKACDEKWRKNGVYKHLAGHADWSESSVPVALVDVHQAEPENRDIFEKHGFGLNGIVSDPQLWTRRPYSEYKPDSPVQFPVVLGRFKAGRYKLFDGIHRAIVLAKRGERTIRVCFYQD